jgi:hypothetical protein
VFATHESAVQQASCRGSRRSRFQNARNLRACRRRKSFTTRISWHVDCNLFRCVSTQPVPSAPGLASLVEVEARLDRMVADARAAATATCEAARRRAEATAATLDAEIEREDARLAAEIAAATDAQVSTIATTTRAEIARFEAIEGVTLAELARRVAARLVALALEEAP